MNHYQAGARCAIRTNEVSFTRLPTYPEIHAIIVDFGYSPPWIHEMFFLPRHPLTGKKL